MKALVTVLICALGFFVSCSKVSEEDDGSDFFNQGGITGLWKSTDEKSDKPRCLVAIYKYQDRYYGRMLATYDANGNIKDTIVEQREKAPGVMGHPPYCGLDFIYNVVGNNEKYRGRIVDPEKGKVYKADFWLSGQDLVVRGKLWIFGRNILWYKASEKDLPKGFKVRDIKNFVPQVPQV